MTNDIYTYIETNFNIKVTDCTFKRDYIKKPLKKCINQFDTRDLPHIDDIIFLYNKLNLQKNQISKILFVSEKRITKIFNILSIRPKVEKINLNNYNYEQVYNLFITQNLSAQECANKLNVSNGQFYNIQKHFNIKKPKELKSLLYKKTMLKKHGIENYSQTEDGRKKLRISSKKSANIVQKKIKQLIKERYGDIVYTNELRDFYKHPLKKDFQGHYIERLSKDILHEYYINKNLRMCDCCKIFNVTQSAMSRFLNEFDIKKPKDLHYKLLADYSNPQKSQETAKSNGTFGKSKTEDIIYELLVQKYMSVQRQYKSELYPFPCDFYIPELDLYIEYNVYWTHGKEQYVGTDEQMKKVKLWESKNTPQYNKAINVWTIRDPLKRQTAKDNGLNYLEFFTIDEFNKWFDKK